MLKSSLMTQSGHFAVAHVETYPMQDGDVPATYANTDALKARIGFAPSTSVEEGVQRFVAWYRSYYEM